MAPKYHEDENMPDWDVFIMYRVDRGAEFYDYFAETPDECMKRQDALDNKSAEFTVFGTRTEVLDRFLAKRFKLREFQKLTRPEKIKLANEYISTTEIMGSSDGLWQFVNTPEYTGFKLKGQPYAADRDFWSKRRW